MRLKDKLGTRSMASGEIKLEGALAYAVGRLDRGFVQMAEMVNWSRLSNGVKSTALMRRALHDAMTVAHGRVVFGKRIVEQPLARRQLLKIMLPLEQALSLCFMTADALDRAESRQPGGGRAGPHPHARAQVPRDPRRAQGHAAMRWRCAAVPATSRSSRPPRLLRDAHLGSIWEGTSNIVALDAVDARGRPASCGSALGAELHARLERGDGDPARLARPAARAGRSRHRVRAVGRGRSGAREPTPAAPPRRSTTWRAP